MTDFFAAAVPVGFVPAIQDVRLVAAAAGVRTWPVDLTLVSSKPELMQAFANDLELPDWFGGNWDALHDVVADPDLIGDPAAIWLIGEGHFAQRYPTLAKTLDEILTSAQEIALQAGQRLWLLRDGQDPAAVTLNH